MSAQTQLQALLESHKFDEARHLLQKNLENGELLDPRSDRQWAPIADGIAAAIQVAAGRPDATVPFWEALLDFFTNSIEPVWGHAHKGHICFRLAMTVARSNLAHAYSLFESAYGEDIALETMRGGTPEEIAQRSQQYSAYVALTILERICDFQFADSTDKERFLDNLFGTSFDAAIRGDTVKSELVQTALATIAPHQALSMCQTRYNELCVAASDGLPFATVSLTGTVLESLLLAVLYYQKGHKTLSNDKDILRVELGPLLQEATALSIFPSSVIQAAFQLVHIFRNRLHPGNELRQRYKLTARVSMTLKILFELALIEWWEHLSSTRLNAV